jgi:hypothetical protein
MNVMIVTNAMEFDWRADRLYQIQETLTHPACFETPPAAAPQHEVRR